MLLLTVNEKQEWRALADEAFAGKKRPEQLKANVRSNTDDYMELFTMHYGS